jgi:hypothetical protein
MKTHGDDDAGSLSLALLLGIVGAGLSMLLLSVVFLQVRTTRSDLQHTSAVNAAQTGIEATLAQIRAATTTDGSGDGDKALLPCGPLTGAISGGATATYTATISYLPSKPPSGDPTWAASHAIRCAAGTGPTSLPLYALIQSTGSAGTGLAARTVFGTYTLHTTTSGNIPGGLIPEMLRGGTPTMCLSADADTLVGGE